MATSGFNPQTMGILGQLFGGFTGNSGAPYEDAMKQYQQYAKKAENVQNPFLQAGQGAIGDFQKWLGGMQDPSAFINHLMGQYQESPWAKYQQQQAIRSGQNAASASGLSGSTPFAQQLEQNASNISSQDMNQWLQNVLGINTQYGAGQQGLINTGQTSANALTSMYGDIGRQMAEAAYGRRAGENQDQSNLWGGLLGLAGNLGGSLASMF